MLIRAGHNMSIVWNSQDNSDTQFSIEQIKKGRKYESLRS
jgi:hypothetical protein